MSGVTLFTPIPNGTINIVATSGAAISKTLSINAGPSLRIKNVSATNVAFVAIGTAAIAATTTGGMPIGLGETVGISYDPATQTTVSAIVAADTATVYFTPGDGV